MKSGGQAIYEAFLALTPSIGISSWHELPSELRDAWDDVVNKSMNTSAQWRALSAPAPCPCNGTGLFPLSLRPCPLHAPVQHESEEKP